MIETYVRFPFANRPCCRDLSCWHGLSHFIPGTDRGQSILSHIICYWILRQISIIGLIRRMSTLNVRAKCPLSKSAGVIAHFEGENVCSLHCLIITFNLVAVSPLLSPGILTVSWSPAICFLPWDNIECPQSVPGMKWLRPCPQLKSRQHGQFAHRNRTYVSITLQPYKCNMSIDLCGKDSFRDVIAARLLYFHFAHGLSRRHCRLLSSQKHILPHKYRLEYQMNWKELLGSIIAL